MLRTALLFSALAFAALLASCVGPAEVRQGFAQERQPVRVILTPAACGSIEDLCSDEMVEATNAYVSSELKFAGFSVIDAVKLSQEARTRDGAPEEVKRFGEAVLRSANPRQHGAIFADLSPAARRALLREARADGVVSVGITIGTADGIGPGRTNQVVIRLGAGERDELVWVTRCSAGSGLVPDIETAIEDATRCALIGALGARKQTGAPPPEAESASEPAPEEEPAPAPAAEPAPKTETSPEPEELPSEEPAPEPTEGVVEGEAGA